MPACKAVTPVGPRRSRPAATGEIEPAEQHSRANETKIVAVSSLAWLRLELLLQLVMAVFMGGAIGVERELKGKPAGLRTNILICLGATLFTSLSLRFSTVYHGDPARVAAQILTGVGFIGAGTILHTRGSVT